MRFSVFLLWPSLALAGGVHGKVARGAATDAVVYIAAKRPAAASSRRPSP